jgi:protein tyrosine phosphatase (PTP) superfamily phosphohydrolase (DUF442 family)
MDKAIDFRSMLAKERNKSKTTLALKTQNAMQIFNML